MQGPWFVLGTQKIRWFFVLTTLMCCEANETKSNLKLFLKTFRSILLYYQDAKGVIYVPLRKGITPNVLGTYDM